MCRLADGGCCTNDGTAGRNWGQPATIISVRLRPHPLTSIHAPPFGGQASFYTVQILEYISRKGHFGIRPSEGSQGHWTHFLHISPNIYKVRGQGGLLSLCQLSIHIFFNAIISWTVPTWLEQGGICPIPKVATGEHSFLVKPTSQAKTHRQYHTCTWVRS